ncbi:hypothetical protein Desmer_2001 [Desulfosporosinus meridiei DSM 13257]|uniref:Uncharacterized protein n=1 Tax=Desulfosporosinus meridiei (strain ATCC BAA-275 / DSM 13257 / KCTC 12902 / NCIMB 13706 / S10) TaxID=768704 RepID=J7IUX3_DESMD|nr:hypothetical protein Desmer_2001 [Desulfosporosinus meridiei DSM 13257]
MRYLAVRFSVKNYLNRYKVITNKEGDEQLSKKDMEKRRRNNYS